MAEYVSESEFAATDGVSEWQPLFWGAKTLFDTGDFATGARLVAAIAEDAAAVGHSPLIDLRPDSVTVTVITVGMGLSDLDVELARRISRTAAGLGLTGDPTAVHDLQLAFDAADPQPVMNFWSAALGYVQVSEDVLIQPNLIGPSLWFQNKDHVAPRNRIHIDLSLPPHEAVARVDAVLAAGGRLLGDKNAPAWWSLIDQEGNVVDICTWQGRG